MKIRPSFGSAFFLALLCLSILSSHATGQEPVHVSPAPAETTQPSSAPATQPVDSGAGHHDALIAILPSGVTVELVAIAHHPLDAAGWWKPDGSSMTEAPPNQLMTGQMYSGAIRTSGVPWPAGAKPYKVFVRYRTPEGQQRVISPRVEGDIARGAHRGVGHDHFFLECIMLLPADAKAGAIRIDVGMDGVEKLVDTRDVNKPADFPIPQSDAEKISFLPTTTDQGRYAVTVEVPADVLNNDFVRPVVSVAGKDVLAKTVFASETPAPGITRLRYEMNAETAHVQRFRLEAFRPREYARFSHVSLDPVASSNPTAEGRAGDQWPEDVRAR